MPLGIFANPFGTNLKFALLQLPIHSPVKPGSVLDRAWCSAIVVGEFGRRHETGNAAHACL
jgi:hypothetical protein